MFRNVSKCAYVLRQIQISAQLKVPKCEIFDRSDFDDFCTIKSLWGGGEFGVKIKVFFLY
jgi:hypothetical protein